MRIDSSQNLYFVLGSSKKNSQEKNSVKRPGQAGVLDCVCVTGLKWFSAIWFSWFLVFCYIPSLGVSP